jgi:hypothetical protein
MTRALIRWGAVVVGVAVLALAGAVPANADESPTAIELVRKLVDADLCVRPKQTYWVTLATCETRDGHTIAIYAFATRAGMEDNLAISIQQDCPRGTDSGRPLRYRVGPTWYSSAYRGAVRSGMSRTIGGKVMTFHCPSHLPQ